MPASIQDIVVVCLVMAAVWLWLDSLRTREIALGICQSACQREGLQLLDQTVALRRIGLQKADNKWHFRRVYRFDFSDEGIGRYTGHLVMLGLRLEELSFGLPTRLDDS